MTASSSSRPPRCCELRNGRLLLLAISGYSEYRDIGDPLQAAAYRKSFAYYNARPPPGVDRVLCVGSDAVPRGLHHALSARVDLAFPLVALVMAIYLSLAFKTESAVVNPEKLYKERTLMVAVIACALAMGLLMVVNIPALNHIFTDKPEARPPLASSGLV